MASFDATSSEHDHLIDVAIALLRYAPDHRMNITSLNKALFYVDLFEYRNTGNRATGFAYIALHQGPVVKKYDKILVPELKKRGLARQARDGNSKPIVLNDSTEYRMPEWMSSETLGVCRSLGGFFGSQTASLASSLSHENPGWRIAYEAGQKAGKSPLPIDFDIAIQQLEGDGESDAWLDDSKDEFTESIQDADAAELTEW